MVTGDAGQHRGKAQPCCRYGAKAVIVRSLSNSTDNNRIQEQQDMIQPMKIPAVAIEACVMPTCWQKWLGKKDDECID